MFGALCAGHLPSGTPWKVGGRDIGTHSEEWRELSSLQAQLLFLHRLQPADPAYHVGMAVELLGQPHTHALAAAVAGVARRNPALRTRFGVQAGSAVGRIDPPGEVRLPIIQLLAGQDPQDMLANVARRPFDLGAGPPHRWCLLFLSPDHCILSLTVHHIVFDGASVGPLIADLEQLAAAARAGTPSSRESLPPHEPRPGRPAHREYWRKALEGLPAAVDLWPRPANGAASLTAAVPSHRWTWEQSTLQKTLELARSHRCTTATVVLAALVTLLHRHTGARDVVVGMAVDLGDRASGIGHRVNVLPVRVGLPQGISFGGLLDATREAALDALDHGDTPFEQIVAAVAPFRSSTSTPLFQVMFTTAVRPSAPRFDGAETRLVPVPTPGAKYDLEITLAGDADSCELTLEADPRRCSPPLLHEFAIRFQTLIGAAVRAPDTRVDDLPLERSVRPRPVLARREAWRRDAAQGDAVGFDEVFRSALRSGPDRIAVRARDGQASYRALDLQVSRLTRELREAGAGPERVVAVCMPRELALPVALLAVARTGAAPLPLDPNQPDERLRALLHGSRVTALVGSDEALARCRFDGPVVRPELIAEPPGGRASDPVRAGHPEQSAYVLATSGSTGRPKMVVMRQEGFAGLMEWAQRCYGDDLAEVLVLTSAGFDLFVFELFAPLSAGGTAVLVGSLEDLPHHPALRHATLVDTVPSVLETLIDLDLLPSTVQAVNVAGEPLGAHLVARVMERRAVAAVRNLYGPTEATTYVTATDPLDGTDSPTIGRAIAGARLCVSAEDGTNLPSGVAGELRIGGPPLARGYLHAPGLTAAAFVPDPAGHGLRAYRSGDLVRSTATGELEFLGRRDHQVKIRGVRVELGEIEAVLSSHPAVRQAAVMLIGTGTDRGLLGCVGTRAGALVTGPDLLAWFSTRLPDVMIPRAWIILDRLPVTANGKTDRQRLAALPITEARLEPVPPRTQMEVAVARCWHAVLHRSDIGVHDVFFDAGGNSLTLLRLQAELQENVNVDVRLIDFFRNPTIAAQAHMLGGVSLPASGASRAAQTGDGRSVADGAERGSARRLARASSRGWRSGQPPEGGTFDDRG